MRDLHALGLSRVGVELGARARHDATRRRRKCPSVDFSVWRPAEPTFLCSDLQPCVCPSVLCRSCFGRDVMVSVETGPPHRRQLPAHRAVLGAHAPGRGSPGRDVAQHFSDPPSTNRMIGPSRRGTPARPAPNSKSSDSHRLFRPPLCKDHRAGVSALTHVRKIQVAVPVDKPACDGLENKLANKQTNKNPLGEFSMPRGTDEAERHTAPSF